VLHTADYFAIYRDRAGWVECKTEEDLRRLAEEAPNRYRLESDRWRCPPGETYAGRLGLTYAVRSSRDINWVSQENMQFLEDYFRGTVCVSRWKKFGPMWPPCRESGSTNSSPVWRHIAAVMRSVLAQRRVDMEIRRAQAESAPSAIVAPAAKAPMPSETRTGTINKAHSSMESSDMAALVDGNAAPVKQSEADGMQRFQCFTMAHPLLLEVKERLLSAIIISRRRQDRSFWCWGRRASARQPCA